MSRTPPSHTMNFFMRISITGIAMTLLYFGYWWGVKPIQAGTDGFFSWFWLSLFFAGVFSPITTAIHLSNSDSPLYKTMVNSLRFPGDE